MDRLRPRYVCLMACLLLCLSGCATVGESSLSHRADDWPPLTMSRAQLIQELGPAHASTIIQINGQTIESLSWISARTEMNPALFIPIVGLFVAASGNGMDSESHRLAVTFDGLGTMTSRSRSSFRLGNHATTTRYKQSF